MVEVRKYILTHVKHFVNVYSHLNVLNKLFESVLCLYAYDFKRGRNEVSLRVQCVAGGSTNWHAF
jgi:hypothetical protein